MKKIVKYALWLFCMIMVISFIFLYSNYSQEQIHKESKRHLQEICTQINEKITTITTNNWLILQEWNELISRLVKEDPDTLKGFINENQQKRQFSEFYFLSGNGYYMTVDEKKGYVNLGQGAQELMNERKNMVFEAILPTGEKTLIFAIPVEENMLGDFSYSAIGMAYTMEQMTSALNIDTYSGIGICHVAHSDGRIIVNSHPDESKYYNMLTYLKQNAKIEKKSITEIVDDWFASSSDVVQYEVDNTTYYLSYQSTGFSDWMLLGLVPAQTVNAVMNQYTLTTLLVMGTVFTLLLISVTVLIILRSRKQIQSQMLEMKFQQKLFDALAQNTSDVFLLFSGNNYKASYVSSNIERVLGIRAEEVLEDIHALSGILVENTPNPIEKKILKSISANSPWVHEQAYRNKLTGEILWFNTIMKNTPIEGRNDLYIMAMSDHTKDRRMNLTLEDALNAANAANDSKRNFLANMSHDIRTPMNAIIGFTSLISEDVYDPAKVREYTDKISASSQHLLGLVNDILDMSKIESGKTSLNNTEFCLPVLLDEIRDMLGPQANSKNQIFQINTQGELPQYLLGDKLRLYQILTNLLTNALKYTQEGGRILMTVEPIDYTKRDHAHLRFTVEDNGCGMTQEFLNHIFEPFARERKMHATEIQGTGLGMAITNTLVNLMGGTIQIQSTPDVGSIFIVELIFPLASESVYKQKAIETTDSHQEKSLSGLRVLAAEDYPFNADLLVKLLEHYHVSCDMTRNGQEALEHFLNSEAGYYDIIILDVQMPVMDGHEATRQIRSSHHPDAASIPIIAMTANAFEDDVKAALNAGMTAHASKPIGKEKLKEILMQYC